MSGIHEIDPKKPWIATGLYAILGMLPSLVSVITLPIYLRYLTVADYGALSLLLFLGGLFGMVSSLQLNAGASIMFFDHNEDGHQLFKFKSTVFSSIIVVNLLIFLMFLWIGQSFFDGFLSDAEITFRKEGLMVMGSAMLSQWLSVYLMFQRNEYRLFTLASYSISTLFLTVSLQYYLIVYVNMGITGSVLGSLVAHSIIVIYLMITESKLINFRIDRSLLIPTLKLSVPLIPLVFLEWFFISGIRLFVEKQLSLEAVGQVALLTTFVVFTNQVFMNFWNAFRPKLLTLLKDPNEVNQLEIKQVISLHIRLSLLCISGALMAGCNLNLLTDNPKWISLISSIPLACLILVPKMLMSIPTLLLMAEKKSQLVMFSMVTGTCILIVGLLTLITPLEIEGVIISLFLANLVSYLLRSYWSKRHTIGLNIDRTSFNHLVTVILLGVFSILLKIEFQFSYGIFGGLQFLLIISYLVWVSKKDLVKIMQFRSS